MYELLQLRNFNGAMAVHAGLSQVYAIVCRPLHASLVR